MISIYSQKNEVVMAMLFLCYPKMVTNILLNSVPVLSQSCHIFHQDFDQKVTHFWNLDVDKKTTGYLLQKFWSVIVIKIEILKFRFTLESQHGAKSARNSFGDWER